MKPIYLRPFISGPPHHFQDPLCDGPHFTPFKITMVWTPEFSPPLLPKCWICVSRWSHWPFRTPFSEMQWVPTFPMENRRYFWIGDTSIWLIQMVEKIQWKIHPNAWKDTSNRRYTSKSKITIFFLTSSLIQMVGYISSYRIIVIFWFSRVGGVYF